MIKILFFITIGAAVISFLARLFITGIFRKNATNTYKFHESIGDLAKQMLNGDAEVELKDNAESIFVSKNNTLILPTQAKNSRGIAGLAAALHECGHAEQYKKSPALYSFFTTIYKVLMKLTIVGLALIVVGLIIKTPWVYGIGLSIFCLLFLWNIFSFIQDFGASRRARAFVTDRKILESDEMMTFFKLTIAIDLCSFATVFSAIIVLIKVFALMLVGRNKQSAPEAK